MNIKKMPNGKYRFREKYQDKDGIWREVSVTMNSKSREAQREALNAIERKIQEKLQKDEKVIALIREMTVNDVFAQSTKKRKMELAPSSYYQENCFINVFLKQFGHRKIKEIKARDLQEYIINNSKSVKTMHALKRGINSIFKYAYIAEYIDSNPIERLDLPKDSRTKESAAKLKQKFFSLEEFDLLIKQMRHDSEDDETERKIDFIEFLFWTGLRIGEALALKWSDFDILDGKLSITKSWNFRTNQLGNVKTVDSVRVIDINARCVEIVQNFRVYRSEFIFATPKSPHIHYMGLTQYLKYEGAKAQLFGKNPDYFSLHMLRHSHVTYLVTMGVPEKMSMERVGHKDPRMMMGVYTHILPENRVTLRQALDYGTSWGQNFEEQKIPKKSPKIIEHNES
ncbi:MAG: site-specific integrase [Lactococcus hircilactis]